MRVPSPSSLSWACVSPTTCHPHARQGERNPEVHLTSRNYIAQCVGACRAKREWSLLPPSRLSLDSLSRPCVKHGHVDAPPPTIHVPTRLRPEDEKALTQLPQMQLSFCHPWSSQRVKHRPTVVCFHQPDNPIRPARAVTTKGSIPRRSARRRAPPYRGTSLSIKRPPLRTCTGP